MTKYNTGNPVGSSSPLDLHDNAENLDAGINGPAVTWRDRRGQTRKSWAGVESDFVQFLADGSTIEFPTWAAASAAAGSGQIPQNRQVAVIGDEGTHLDPVSGLEVSNSGRFLMVGAGLEWRSADTITSLKQQIVHGASADIGLSASPVSGTASSVRTYVVNVPASRDAIVSRIRLWALSAGPVFVRVFSREGNTFTAEGPGVTVFAPQAGPIELEWPDLPVIAMKEGQFIGIYAPSGRIAFTNEPFRPGYFQADGDVLTFTTETLTDTVTLQFGVVLGFSPESLNAAVENIADQVDSSSVIGLAGIPVTGAAASGNTYVFADPLSKSGPLSRFKMFALAQGVVQLKVFERSGSSLAQVGPNYPVRVDVGLNDFGIDRLPALALADGQFIGLYVPSGLLAYATATSPRSTWYGASPNGDVASVAMTTVALNSLSLQIGFEVGMSKDLLIAQLRKLINGTRLMLDRYYVGQQDQLGAGTSASGNTYAMARASMLSGRLSRLRAYANADGVLHLKVFAKNGANLSQVGLDALVRLKAGLNELGFDELPEVFVEAGQYLGFYVASGVLAYQSGADASGGWWSGSNLNVGSLNVGIPTTNTRLQFGLEVGVQYPDVVSSLGGLVTRVATLESGSSVPLVGEVISAARFDSSGLTATVTVSLARFGEHVATVMDAGRSLSVPSTPDAVRYDLYVIDAVTQAISVIEGSERIIDPTAGIPVLTDSRKVPIFLVRVTRSRASAVDLWREYAGNIPRIARWLEMRDLQSRRNLRKVVGKIRRGDPIRIAGFGDSITALQSGGPSTSSPNGPTRDRATAPLSGNNHYLRDGYAEDVVDAIPLFTALELGRTDDGAGRVHTRVGAIWRLVEDLERYGYTLGVDLWYDNWAVSSAISQGAGSAWLGALVAAEADLVIHAFGMNERGSSDSEARMLYAANALKGSGKDVLFLQCPRPRVGTIASWEYTNRVISRVAEYSGSGLSVVEHLAQYPELMGIALEDICEANKQNHPGLRELDAMGRELSRVLLPGG